MSVKHAVRVINKFITDPDMRFCYLAKAGCFDRMDDAKYLGRLFEAELGYRLNLKDPKTFNEKTQWLKLNTFKHEYTDYADKVKVKPLVAEFIGEDHIIPTIGVWDRAVEIDFAVLPERFAIKCNHTSTSGVCICKDKSSLNTTALKRELDKAMKSDYFAFRREKPYRDIEKKILAEELLVETDGSLPKDYKVFVFNGRSRFVQVDIDRFTRHRRNFYDADWNYIPFTTCYPTDPDADVISPGADTVRKMFDMAEKVANGIDKSLPFLRVDFYVVNNQIYFGEVTFYHGAGIERFDPQEYDRKLGDMMDISGVKGACVI